MKTVEFIKDFGAKKKGDKANYDSSFASNLVKLKAAKIIKAEPSTPFEKAIVARQEAAHESNKVNAAKVEKALAKTKAEAMKAEAALKKQEKKKEEAVKKQKKAEADVILEGAKEVEKAKVKEAEILSVAEKAEKAAAEAAEKAAAENQKAPEEKKDKK